jgi:hypothetical protein
MEYYGGVRPLAHDLVVSNNWLSEVCGSDLAAPAHAPMWQMSCKRQREWREQRREKVFAIAPACLSQASRCFEDTMMAPANWTERAVALGQEWVRRSLAGPKTHVGAGLGREWQEGDRMRRPLRRTIILQRLA